MGSHPPFIRVRRGAGCPRCSQNKCPQVLLQLLCRCLSRRDEDISASTRLPDCDSCSFWGASAGDELSPSFFDSVPCLRNPGATPSMERRRIASLARRAYLCRISLSGTDPVACSAFDSAVAKASEGPIVSVSEGVDISGRTLSSRDSRTSVSVRRHSCPLRYTHSTSQSCCVLVSILFAISLSLSISPARVFRKTCASFRFFGPWDS